MSLYTNHDGQRFVTGQELGRGGEGAVFTLAGRSDVVAKIYHPDQRTTARQAKLRAMLTRPPRDPCQAFAPPHISLTWPTDLLLEQGAFAGFLMPRIERSPNIFALFNPKLRQLRFPQANRRFLYHTAQNLAAALHALHAAGCVMGDVNQKNILVKTNALVTLVDADSFQVQDADGVTYRCPVGVPDYTPPELQGKVLEQVDRQRFHDDFGLGVLIFQLLMEGYHPFTGKPLTQALSQVDQLSLHCMQQGIFPYQPNSQVQPPADAPRFAWLQPELQQLFLQTFLTGYSQPAQRPTAQAWAQALHKAEQALVHCQRQPAHWYGAHLGQCPYCQQKSWANTPVARTASRSPLLRPMTTPAKPTPPAAQSGWWQKVVGVLGTLYLLPVVFGLLTTHPWLLLTLALIGGLCYLGPGRVARQTIKLGRAVGSTIKISCVGLWSALVWIAGGLSAFWQARTPRFKRVVLVVAAVALFWGVTGKEGDLSSAGVAGQSQLGAQSSPLPTPTDRYNPFASPLR